MNSSAAARSIGMRRTLRGGGRAVFEKSARRHTRQTGDLDRHVGLVGVAGVERPVDERTVAQRLQPTEAEHARERLRAVADGGTHATLELTGAHPELTRDLGDAGAATVERGDGGVYERVACGGRPLERATQERM